MADLGSPLNVFGTVPDTVRVTGGASGDRSMTVIESGKLLREFHGPLSALPGESGAGCAHSYRTQNSAQQTVSIAGCEPVLIFHMLCDPVQEHYWCSNSSASAVWKPSTSTLRRLSRWPIAS